MGSGGKGYHIYLREHTLQGISHRRQPVSLHRRIGHRRRGISRRSRHISQLHLQDRTF